MLTTVVESFGGKVRREEWIVLIAEWAGCIESRGGEQVKVDDSKVKVDGEQVKEDELGGGRYSEFASAGYCTYCTYCAPQ